MCSVPGKHDDEESSVDDFGSDWETRERDRQGSKHGCCFETNRFLR